MVAVIVGRRELEEADEHKPNCCCTAIVRIVVDRTATGVVGFGRPLSHKLAVGRPDNSMSLGATVAVRDKNKEVVQP